MFLCFLMSRPQVLAIRPSLFFPVSLMNLVLVGGLQSGEQFSCVKLHKIKPVLAIASNTIAQQ